MWSSDLILALIASGAYFVCEAFGMFDRVFYRGHRFEGASDEISVLKDMLTNEQTIGDDDISSVDHSRQLIPVLRCVCSPCLARRTHRLSCDCYLCKGSDPSETYGRCSSCATPQLCLRPCTDRPINWEPEPQAIHILVDDRVVITYCGECGGHRQHADDCETRYDVDDD